MLATMGDHGEQAGEGSFGTWSCFSSLLLELLVTGNQSWDHRPRLQHPELPWEELAWGLLSCQCILPSQGLQMIRIILSSPLGGWDVTAGLGQPEAALCLESRWGGAVSADHFCQLPVAAQQLICAPAPFEK